MTFETYERLDMRKAAVLFVDHQTGLMSLVTDIAPDEFKTNLSALVDITNQFKLPCILTSSMEHGPNGPIVPYVVNNIKPQHYIERDGEINSWDNEKFREAVYEMVKKNKRTQFIVAGVVTEVCVGFLVLSLLHEKKTNPLMKDIQVFVAVDSSGTTNKLVREASWERMSKAGAELMTWFAIACELRVNWHPLPVNNKIPMDDFAKLVIDRCDAYSYVFDSYTANTKKTASKK